jgi:hypothetical protein
MDKLSCAIFASSVLFRRGWPILSCLSSPLPPFLPARLLLCLFSLIGIPGISDRHARNHRSACFGFGDRLPPESLIGISRIMQNAYFARIQDLKTPLDEPELEGRVFIVASK